MNKFLPGSGVRNSYIRVSKMSLKTDSLAPHLGTAVLGSLPTVLRPSKPREDHELLYSNVLKSNLVSFDWPPGNTCPDALWLVRLSSFAHCGFGSKVSTTRDARTEWEGLIPQKD